MTAPLQLDDQPTTDLLAAYKPPPRGFDELLDDAGGVRPHWQAFFEGLASLAPRELQARAKRLERQVRDTGLAHDIFADPDASELPWRLNLVPLIIAAEEWRALERGLEQRALLFNAILADIYGPQNLLRDGLIPPALVFADPAYLRNCHGIVPPGGHLQFYAADIARAPDGTWRVMDSHAETPAGVGHAVANRVMQADVNDDILTECDVRRMASHFQQVQSALRRRAGGNDPGIALLTPGPLHDDYFSHAYLARYFGAHLVEGGDLRVVGDQLFLKTLAGLKQVDTIVRCIEGAKADPLELDPAAFDGPVGLLNACRKAPSLSANALGSAVIENRGLGGYLPAICQHVLGEDLLLWDAPRWWLGDEAALAHVESALDSMIIRPAQEGTGRPGRAALGRSSTSMSVSERELLRRDMAMFGARLVAEQPIGFSTMPVLTNKGIRPQAVAVRVYVAGSGQADTAKGTAGEAASGVAYSVLPGGVAMAVDAGAAVALSASNGDTHDVWVLADGPEKPHVSLWGTHLESARIDRAQRTLQSRVADNLFWLGRYLERADWTMRVVRSALGRRRRLEYFDSSASGQPAEICLHLLLDKGKDSEALAQAEEAAISRGSGGITALARALVTDKTGIYSLEQSYKGIYRVANLTRDRLSLEAWKSVSAFRIGEGWHKRMTGASASELQDEIEDKLAAIATFGGHMHESMTRNYGWYFLDMGRRLERGYNLCDTLNALFAQAGPDDSEADSLKFVLELADSFITYRSRYRLEPMLPLVLDLLMIDESNPRSLGYQLSILTKQLEGLPQASDGNSLTLERRIVLEMQTAVRLANIDALCVLGTDRRRAKLAAMLDHVLTELPALSEAISRRYFRLTDDEPHRVASQSGARA